MHRLNTALHKHAVYNLVTLQPTLLLAAEQQTVWAHPT